MADQTRHIMAKNLDPRFPVVNARDELGQLAGVFAEQFGTAEDLANVISLDQT